MSAVVVDTDVMSFIFKGDTREALYQPHLGGKLVVLSFMTAAELDRWGIERNWGQAKRKKLADFIGRFIIAPYTRDLCRTWAKISDEAKRAGRPIKCADAWIAATALIQGVPLVTHNRGDYAGVSTLTVISEAP